MNVNLQKYVGIGNPGNLSVETPVPEAPVESVRTARVGGQFTMTEGGGPTVEGAVPKNRPEIDAAEKNANMSLTRLTATLKNLDKSLSSGGPLGAPANGNGVPANGNGKPANGNGKPAPAPAPEPRTETVFNLVALLDLMQQAGFEGMKISREIKQQEREVKAAAQENTADIIRSNGEINSSSAFSSAMIGLGSAIGSTALSSVSFGLQCSAYNENCSGKFEVDIKDTEKELKLAESYKDPGGVGLQFEGKDQKLPLEPVVEEPKINELKKGSEIELVEVKEQPKVEAEPPKINEPKKESGPFDEKELGGLRGKVDRCKGEVDEANANLTKLAVDEADAKARLGDVVKGGNKDEIAGVRNELNATSAERLNQRRELELKVDEHIRACTTYRDAMDAQIAQKQATLAKETDPLKRTNLQNQVNQMQAIRNKECFEMAKGGLTSSLNHRLNFVQENMKGHQGEVMSNKNFINSREWETVAAFVRQMLDATGQSFSRMDSEKKEAQGKEAEHLSQAAETRCDMAIDASEGMQQNCRQVLKMVIDLRQAVAQADHESMRAILRM